MPSGQNQSGNGIDPFIGKAASIQSFDGKLSTLHFIVRSSRIVDDIMKPNSELEIDLVTFIET